MWSAAFVENHCAIIPLRTHLSSHAQTVAIIFIMTTDADYEHCTAIICIAMNIIKRQGCLWLVTNAVKAKETACQVAIELHRLFDLTNWKSWFSTEEKHLSVVSYGENVYII